MSSADYYALIISFYDASWAVAAVVYSTTWAFKIAKKILRA